MNFFGRRIILTTLDPLPRLHRAVPGYLALNQIEIDAIRRNAEDDAEIIKPLIEIVLAENDADANRTFIFKPRKVTRTTPKLSPSTRLFMLGAVLSRRHPKVAA